MKIGNINLKWISWEWRIVFWVAAICYLLFSLPAKAGPRLHIERDGAGNVHFRWEGAGERTILEKTSELKQGFAHFGNVMNTQSNSISPPSENTVFYRLRNVKVLGFNDVNLQASVRRNIGEKAAPTNELYDIDIENMEDLFAEQVNISDLNGLEDLQWLRNLWLQQNVLKNITSLMGHKQLEVLDIRGGFVSNLSPLSGILTLISLKLGGNEFSSLQSLQNLSLLKDIEASNTELSNLNGLENLSGLISLDLGHNHIQNLGPLQYLNNLEIIILENNNIVEIGTLSALPNLLEIDLSYNQITDVQALLNNTGIGAGDRIRLEGNPIADYNQIVALRAKGAIVSYE